MVLAIKERNPETFGLFPLREILAMATDLKTTVNHLYHRLNWISFLRWKQGIKGELNGRRDQDRWPSNHG